MLPTSYLYVFEDQPVRTRRNGTEIVVAADDSGVLRRGDPAVIAEELAAHRSLLERGYPVAQILDAGDGWYMEEHLGQVPLGRQLGAAAPNTSERSAVFARLLGHTRAYAAAQATEPRTPVDVGTMLATLRIDRNEPLFDDSTMLDHAAAVERMTVELHGAAGIPSHGDFSAWNIFDGGVIDFEDAFLAPIPYDLVSAVVTPDAFQTEQERPSTEMLSVYRFTPDERRALLDLAWELAGENAPRTIPACVLLRWHWLLREMDHMPVLQAFRLERTQEIIRRYVAGTLDREAIVAGT